MHKHIIIFALAFASGQAFSDTSLTTSKNLNHQKHISIHDSSKKKSEIQLNHQQRTRSFPTQIVRLNLDLSNQNIQCDEISNAMNDLLIFKLKNKAITYLITQTCYRSEKGEPDYYTLSAFFDPQTDDAITYLQTYSAENNGKDFFGVPFIIESAKGVIISLKIMEGIKTSRDKSTSTTLYSLNNKLYFNNVYDMDNTLINDIENKLNTDNYELISSFIT